MKTLTIAISDSALAEIKKAAAIDVKQGLLTSEEICHAVAVYAACHAQTRMEAEAQKEARAARKEAEYRGLLASAQAVYGGAATTA